MKNLISLIILLLTTLPLSAQKAEDFGFRHFQIMFEHDTVDILISSKKGEENKRKPLFFYVQGSLAVPLIVHNGEKRISYTSMVEGFVEKDYHLVIISKPGIPLTCQVDSLSNRREYYQHKAQKIYPKKCINDNYLNYYVRRNNKIIAFLKEKSWVDATKMVVAGHSQGSGIAAAMAENIPGITHLIYSNGLPYYSTILAMLRKERMQEDEEENPWVGKTLEYWENVVERPLDVSNTGWDTNLTMNAFSQSENELLKRLKIPVLISYGTKDESAPYQDMFQIETIKDRVSHISFKDYIGLGHNYQLTKSAESVNKSKDYLGTVMQDWLLWLSENQ